MWSRFLVAALSLMALLSADAIAQTSGQPAASGATAAFKPPAPGTRISRALDDGKIDVVTVDSVEGMTVRTKGGTEYYAGFFRPAVRMEFDVKQVESLWPLDVGRSVRFEAKNSRIQSAGPDSQFVVELEVVARETVRVGERDVPTFVIKQRVRNLTRGKNRIDTRTWFAPSYGVPVKYHWEQYEGRTYDAQGNLIKPNGWIATRIQVPK